MGAGRGLGEDGLKPGYKVTKHIGTDRLHGQCLPEPVLSCLSCRNKKDTRRRHVAFLQAASLMRGDAILSLRRESMQRSAENLPYGSRTLQTAKEGNGQNCSKSNLFAVSPFGIPLITLLKIRRRHAAS